MELFDRLTIGWGVIPCFSLYSIWIARRRSVSLIARAKLPGEAMVGEDVDLVEIRHPMDAMEPYERLLGDALEGDHTLFGSYDGIAAAWRIVEPIIHNDALPQRYDSGGFGPTVGPS